MSRRHQCRGGYSWHLSPPALATSAGFRRSPDQSPLLSLLPQGPRRHGAYTGAFSDAPIFAAIVPEPRIVPERRGIVNSFRCDSLLLGDSHDAAGFDIT